MNNETLSHFAKYLEQEIWNTQTEQTVILKGIRSETLLYLNGKPEEQEGAVEDFRIMLNNDDELTTNNLPPDLCVVFVEKTKVRKPLEVTPEMFLNKLKMIIYVPMGVTHDYMLSLASIRKRELVLARQIIIASYFCVFEHNKNYKISLTDAGAIYNKNHATAINCIKAVNNLLETDRHFREDYAEVWKLCRSINPKSRLKI